MLEYEVTNRAELIAAVKAAVQSTFDRARANPVHIVWGRCHYTFPAGIHTGRAKQLARDIRRVVSARAA